MKTYTLKEVSRILAIPKSTLRYWEKEGLIRAERNEQNEYREYTTEELITIGNIAFYRSLHLPIKALKNLYEQSIEDHYVVMESSYQAIDKQVKELRTIQKKLKQRMLSVHVLDALRVNQPQHTTPNFSYVCHLHMENQDSVKNYLDNQNSLAIVFDEQHFRVERYGITQNAYKQEQTLLWEQKPNVTYIPYLQRVIQRNVVYDDIQHQLTKLHKENKKIGNIVGNYLATDKNIDYFQCWIEIL